MHLPRWVQPLNFRWSSGYHGSFGGMVRFTDRCVLRCLMCWQAQVVLYGCEVASDLYHLPRVQDFHTEYSALAMSVRIVDDVGQAIDHVHQYGSSHTDCIVTEDAATASRWLQQVHRSALHACSKVRRDKSYLISITG